MQTLFCAKTRVDIFTLSITFAILKVFQVPVAPSNTWYFSPFSRPLTNSSIDCD